MTNTEHFNTVSEWLTAIAENLHGTYEHIRLKPDIYLNPTKYAEYLQFNRLYKEYCKIDEETFGFSDAYSIEALEIMAKLSNLQKEYAEWYKIMKPMNDYLQKTGKKGMMMKAAEHGIFPV